MKFTSNILTASAELCRCLEVGGQAEHLPRAHVLFRVDDSNAGVFLVRRGRVALQVKDLPRLDRVFSAGAVLGLPSTFSGSPYSLTAVTLADSDIVHVQREVFLQLMRQQPVLCREAINMLSREQFFIQAALAARRRQERKARKQSMGMTRDGGSNERDQQKRGYDREEMPIGTRKAPVRRGTESRA